MMLRRSLALLSSALIVSGCLPADMEPVRLAAAGKAGRRRRAAGAAARSRAGRDLRLARRRRADGAGDRRHRLPPRAAAQPGRLRDVRGAGVDRHRHQGAVPLPRRARGQGDALRHRHRPRGLRLDRCRHHRPRGQVAALDAAAGDDRARPEPRQVGGRPAWRGQQPARGAGALHQLRRGRLRATASTAPTRRRRSAGPPPPAASGC